MVDTYPALISYVDQCLSHGVRVGMVDMRVAMLQMRFHGFHTWFCIKFAHRLYEAGTHAITIWHQVGTKMVPTWYKLGTKFTPQWRQLNTKLVPTWFHLGTNLVPSCYQVGVSFLLIQYQLRNVVHYKLCTCSYQLLANFVPSWSSGIYMTSKASIIIYLCTPPLAVGSSI